VVEIFWWLGSVILSLNVGSGPDPGFLKGGLTQGSNLWGGDALPAS